jgi:hypothetical protein
MLIFIILGSIKLIAILMDISMIKLISFLGPILFIKNFIHQLFSRFLKFLNKCRILIIELFSTIEQLLLTIV